MRTKKILSAVIAMSMTASALAATGALQASAAENQLTFDIRSGGKNEVRISAEDIAAGDFTVPVDIFIPENPGVNAVQLKLQVNDGEVQADGSFKNYGLYLSDAALASPYCFDSANSGDATQAFANNFNASKMNLSWVYSQNTKVNADASSEANTTTWNSKSSLAYKNAFATANLVVPKDTKPGTYQLDIRKEKFANAVNPGKFGQSACASADSTESLSYNSIPLSVVVEDISAKENWVDSYKIANGGHYIILGDVCGAPGETVDVPVYIFGDTGTAGLQLFFDYDHSALTLNKYAFSKDNVAYRMAPQANASSTPASYVIADKVNHVAKDGSILTMMNFTIPASASEGTVYDIKFYNDEEEAPLKIVDYDSKQLNVKYYNGSITVLATGKTALNRSAVNFTEAGATANLTLFNADGTVTWKSSDPAVATVDENGFVTAVGKGDATITATNNGKDYTCTVKFGGLYGDVDASGDVSATDAQLTLMHYVAELAGNKGSLTVAQQAIADVDGDKKVTSGDAQMILIYYVKAIVAGNKNTTWYEITGNENSPKTPQA